MPIIPAHRSPLVLLRGFRDKALSRTNITNFDADTKYRAISDVLTEELLSLREEQISVVYANQLSNASGQALDEIGERLGLPRVRASHALVDATERSLTFYVESGNFGSINGGSNITLPVNTVVSSEPNSNELGTAVQYQLTQPYTLLSTESLQYCSARAVNIGTGSNVGSSVLRVHNFSGYVDSASSSLKCVNIYPILNGVDNESDDLYRYRLANHYNRTIQVNETRLKLTALPLPGINNSRVEPGYFGIGTAAVFALGPENQANPRLVTGLQERLNSWNIPGGEYTATPATEVKFDFEIEVTPNRALSPNQLARLKAEINKGFLAYFRSLGLGAVIDLSALAQTVQKKVITAAAFTQRGGDRLFKRVYVRKGFSGGPVDERSKLVGTAYVLEADEYGALGTLEIEVAS